MIRALATAALGVALCLAAATFDSASLYLPGVVLVLVTVAAAAWVVLAARGARVVRHTGPPTVVEEEPYPLRVEVRAGLLPPPGGELIEPLLGWPVPIGGRWSRRVRINVRFSRRGRRTLEPSRLVIRDPLGLFSREVAGAGGEELLVLPRTERVRAVGDAGGAAGSADPGELAVGRLRLEGTAAELEIDGLRPYREGAPASRIHWPAVARSGEMLERRMVSDLDSAPLVVLDASAPEDLESLDRAVRAAASLCLHLARTGACAILLPGERRAVDVGSDLGAWPHVHARLAVVEGGVAVTAPARAPRSGAVFWVSAAQTRALHRLPAAARYLVAPGRHPGLPVSFEVAGCIGQALSARGRHIRSAA